jgi:hypothetical protein
MPHESSHRSEDTPPIPRQPYRDNLDTFAVASTRLNDEVEFTFPQFANRDAQQPVPRKIGNANVSRQKIADARIRKPACADFCAQRIRSRRTPRKVRRPADSPAFGVLQCSHVRTNVGSIAVRFSAFVRQVYLGIDLAAPWTCPASGTPPRVSCTPSVPPYRGRANFIGRKTAFHWV